MKVSDILKKGPSASSDSSDLTKKTNLGLVVVSSPSPDSAEDGSDV